MPNCFNIFFNLCHPEEVFIALGDIFGARVLWKNEFFNVTRAHCYGWEGNFWGAPHTLHHNSILLAVLANICNGTDHKYHKQSKGDHMPYVEVNARHFRLVLTVVHSHWEQIGHCGYGRLPCTTEKRPLDCWHFGRLGCVHSWILYDFGHVFSL